MRGFITFYLNGKLKKVEGEKIFLPLSTYLRDEVGLKGTKVVCAEGDCGACTVLLGTLYPHFTEFQFKAVNSCIFPLFLVDCCHVITVEGLKDDEKLGPVQKAMMENHGAQCGYCTPGFVTSLTSLALDEKKADEKKVKNYLTGNLCRCTGYKGIIESALKIDFKKVKKHFLRYLGQEFISEMKKQAKEEVFLKNKNLTYYAPKKIEDALNFRKKEKETTIIGSGTDLYVMFNKDRFQPKKMLSLHGIKDLHKLKIKKKEIEVGARVTLDELQKVTKDLIPEFSNLLNVFASPQIKNVGTLVGNVMNASPVGDTLPLLLSLKARVVVRGPLKEREILFEKLYKGYKDLAINKNEIMTKIIIPIPEKDTFFKVYKVSKRKDLDISTISMAMLFKKDKEKRLQDVRLSYGGVAATPIRLFEAEKVMEGRVFDLELIDEVSKILRKQIKPLTDVRGSADYRLRLCENLLKKIYFSNEEGVDHE